MALETKAIDIDKDAYTIIGAAVTSLTAKSRRNEPFVVVVLPAGDTAPLVGETDIVTILKDSNFGISAVSFDAYALATDLEDTLEIVRS